MKYLKSWLTILFLFLSVETKVSALEDIPYQNTILLTPQQLVAEVLQANPQLEIAQATWEAALARVAQHASFEDPTFSYSMAPLTIEDSRTDYGQRIEISQKLPWPGKLNLRSETASYKADAINQSIQDLQLKLSLATNALFIDWYIIHQAIDINHRKQALLKDIKDIAVSQYSTGLATKQDALQAEMEFVLLEHQSIALTRKQRSIRTHINTLLNIPPESPLALPAKLTEITTLPEVKKFQQQALLKRPELKRIEATLNAAKSQSKLAIKNSYPDITLKAGYNSLWENSNKHFTVGIGLNIPLFQEKHRAAENEALAQIKQAEWQRVDFIAKLKEEIQISYDRTLESIHILSLHNNKILPLAKAIFDTAKSDYQSGNGNYLNLINSEKKYLQILLQTKHALANTHLNFAKLENSAGFIKPFIKNSKEDI